MSYVDWFKSKDNELNYEISIYDFENDLIERFNVSTENEKNKILEEWYHNKKESQYYEVKESKIIEKDLKNKQLI